MIPRHRGPGARTPSAHEHLDKLAEALATGDRLLGRVALEEIHDYVCEIEGFWSLAGFHCEKKPVKSAAQRVGRPGFTTPPDGPKNHPPAKGW